SSTRATLAGSSNAASANGSPLWPACAIASRTNAGNDAASSSPCWYAASSPYECANAPAGKAESASCHTSQSNFDISSSRHFGIEWVIEWPNQCTNDQMPKCHNSEQEVPLRER